VNEIAGPGAYRESSPPSPSANRGALSEAWYRALYGSQSAGSSKAVPAAQRSRAASPPERAAGTRPGNGNGERATVRTTASGAAGERRALTIASVSRMRERRSVAANVAVRAAAKPVVRRGSCVIDAPEGRIELLVQRRGRCVRVTALASGPASVRVASALARVRAALLAHGLRPHIDLREKGIS